MARVSKRDMAILKMRSRGMTCRKIGKAYSITRERVRQIVARVMRIARHTTVKHSR